MRPVAKTDAIVNKLFYTSSIVTLCNKMAYQGELDDEYLAALAVLEDEVNGGDPALDAAAVILARRGVMVRDLVEMEQRDRQPTRVEGYVDEIVPMYNNNEFKSHLRRTCMEFKILRIMRSNQLKV